ncbi:MAG: site-2 protease family protein [Alphaproteobacteria bacterium]|nr:site-2 protease family protein [Alphaproteobacteria bacterium]
MPQAIFLFEAGSIPVFVSPWYLVLIGWWTYHGGLVEGLLFVVAATVSLLVHEFGHGLVARHYRLNPRILLHAWGGLCAHEIPTRDDQAIRITAAGPAAGLLLGGVALAALVTSSLFGLGDLVPNLDHLLLLLVVVNVIWSVLNLAPLYPLDGGQLFRLYMHRWVAEPKRAERIVHGVGVALGGVGTVVGLGLGAPFLAVILGLLTWQNLRVLMGEASSGPIYRQFRVERTRLDEGRAVLDADPAEAIRVGHQVRATAGLSDALDQEAWELITLGHARQQDWDDVLRVARRARPSPAVAGAVFDAHLALGNLSAAERAMDAAAWKRQPVAVRQAQQARLLAARAPAKSAPSDGGDAPASA